MHHGFLKVPSTIRGVGILLILAAAPRIYQYAGASSPPASPLQTPDFQLALIGFEVSLGLWLVSGALPAAARRVAVGCFSVFACYTFYEAIAGKSDCGCFGQVHVKPWYTFILDVSLVLMLAFVGRRGTGDAGHSRWAQKKWPVAAAAAIGLAVGVATAALHPKAVSAANGLATADSGKLVILEPQRWLGHRLPVLAHIVSAGAATPGTAGVPELPLGQRLSTDNWTIMFYHASCGECRATIPVYEQLAQRELNSGRTPHVVFVRVPSGSGISTRGLFHSSLALHATLDATHEWFAQTPIAVQLHNGTVTAAVTGTAAMNLSWRRAAIR